MRASRVIGKVVLSQSLYPQKGGRWLLVSPMDGTGLADLETPHISPLPSPVVYDCLGATDGDVIAMAESSEASRPFDVPMPIDAYNAAILDHITFKPTT